ncbi:ankyrin repeat-containing domain protein, partial [Massariosphaeria phaeospora]
MALQSAAAFGDVAVARSLVEHGADVNAKPDTQHPYALAAAAKGQHFNMVDYLLGLGAEANPPYDGGSRQPPMAAAAEGGSVEIIDKLIAAGGPLDAKKLMRAACAKGHLTVVKRLIEAGAAIDTDRPLSDGERTPLVEAAGGGYVGIVQELLNSGANVNVAAPSRESNALQAAAGSGSLKTVRILLDAGAEVNAPAGTWSRTALQMACHKGHSAIVELLLDAGARFEDDARESTYPALEQAIKGGHLYIADRLLPEMDIRGVDFRGRPCTRALYAAVDMGYEEVVRQLLELGTPTQDGIGHFTEHLVCCAAMKGHTEIVKILLDAGAKMNGEARYRGTALQSAVNGDHLETAKVLLEYGADPDAVQASVEPSLYLAARRGNVEMFELLLDTGANVYTKSYSGKTIRHGAEKHGNAEILRLLDQKEAETAEKPKEDEPLDVSTVTRGRLCGTCEKLPYEVFGSGRRNIETLHPSLTAVRDAAREGCSFCMFLWKQLRVKTVTIPQPSKVSLYQSGGKDGWQVQLDEPYPKDVESPRRLITGFCVIVEPFEEKRKPLPESSSSAQTYAQIQSWLSDCAQNHPKCRLDSGSEFLPTRLLDLRHWKSGKALSLVNSTDLPRSGFQLNNEAGEPVSVQAMKSQPWWDKMYEEGPLSKLVRGFLERELSPRVLHYTSHQVLWECRTLKASEGLPTGDV